MRFIVGLLVGISLVVGALLIPQVREKAAEFSGLVQRNATDMNRGIVDRGKPEVIDLSTDPSPLLPEENYLPTKPTNLSPDLSVARHVEEGTPMTHPATQNKATMHETEKAQRQASADGSLQRAAEGSLQEAAEGSFQPIWIPFRSEVSARGFATRLHQQVKTEFQVVKIRPGEYEVGFYYHSTKERTRILRNISRLTGLESRLATRSAPQLASDFAEPGSAE